ncbi:hypothetical protein [Sphingomonas faeni]|uniref:hypothetical protein n=1 Tax=Sphingomonas faeni TaxID=185950 RepID=UPI00334E940A
MSPHATIWRADSPLARCRSCGAQQQFHGRPNFSCTAFAAETAADIDPEDLSPSHLVDEIFAHPHTLRAVACGDELRGRLLTVLGVSWDDLSEALA